MEGFGLAPFLLPLMIGFLQDKCPVPLPDHCRVLIEPVVWDEPIP